MNLVPVFTLAVALCQQENKYSSILQALDKIFVTIFAVEILVKWYHGFWSFWKVGWNVFDFLLVLISVVGDGKSE